MKLKHVLFGIFVLWASVALCGPPGFHLSGTMKSQSEKIAYIDGQVYRINDDVSGYLILDITDLGIKVKKQGNSEVYFVGIGALSTTSLIEEVEVSIDPVVPVENIEPQIVEPQIISVKPEKKGFSLGGARGILSIILLVVGFFTALIGSLLFIIAGFREGIWWGLGVLFVPFVDLIFLIMRWRVAAKPFWISLVGLVFCFLGGLAAPGSWGDYQP
jgi:hypothetical protein